ncbi:TetR family transcriptional regulator [Streptomyces abyssalis]|uniref:TetR family transcriptional regulator n=1 Tax=Streptomyces abyssalis TaxID=933944 RepID=UPI001495AAF7|nr:TetR family transcriptional regulator [Streptomyces abyssalis]
MSLRERKKALTRASIEDTGLRLFVDRGYEATTIDDICGAVLISRRTFFRYFSSKEDVVLAGSREGLGRAAEQLRLRPPGESLHDSLYAPLSEAAAFFESDRDTQLIRTRLLARTPALAGSYLRVLTDFEHLLRGFLAERCEDHPDAPRVRLVAAATVTAFRVAIESWTESSGTIALEPLARRNLGQLLTGCRL